MGSAKNMDVAANVKFLQLFKPESLTSTANGTGVDVTEMGGRAVIFLKVGDVTGTSPTLDVKIQDSITTGGTFADVTGATFTQVTASDASQVIALNLDGVKQAIRAVATIAGTSPDFTFDVIVAGAGVGTVPVSTNP